MQDDIRPVPQSNQPLVNEPVNNDVVMQPAGIDSPAPAQNPPTMESPATEPAPAENAPEDNGLKEAPAQAVMSKKHKSSSNIVPIIFALLILAGLAAIAIISGMN